MTDGKGRKYANCDGKDRNDGTEKTNADKATRSKIVVKQNGRLFPLIYDKKRHCVITVLTMEMLSASKQEEVMAVECSA